MIKFENIHGKFELDENKVYNITVVDEEKGDVYIHWGINPIESASSMVKFEGNLFIEKKIIVEVIECEDEH